MVIRVCNVGIWKYGNEKMVGWWNEEMGDWASFVFICGSATMR